MKNKKKLKVALLAVSMFFWSSMLKKMLEKRKQEKTKAFYQDKIVWITGASSGIGEAITYELDKFGAKIIISSRRKEALRKVRDNCENKDNISILTLDVADLASIPDKVTEAVKKFGRIDILINNAGISQRSLAEETETEIDQELMNINFFGPVTLTKELLPEMIAQKGGQIVVVSSLVGKFGTPLRSAYSASKHALHGFFDSMRLEYFQDNILVTIVCPGFVKTNISANAYIKDREKYANLSRGLEADDCARQILNGIAAAKEEFLVGRFDKFGVYLKNIAPTIFSKAIKKAKVV